MIATFIGARFGSWFAVFMMLALISGGAVMYHRHVYQQGFDAAVNERAARDGIAIINRAQDNAALSIKQNAINAFITKDKDEKLAPVVARITAERVRVGSAICGPTAPAKAESSSGSDGADSSSRLVRSDVDRDIRALKIAVETDLATGRACQTFVIENGLAP